MCLLKLCTVQHQLCLPSVSRLYVYVRLYVYTTCRLAHCVLSIIKVYCLEDFYINSVAPIFSSIWKLPLPWADRGSWWQYIGGVSPPPAQSGPSLAVMMAHLPYLVAAVFLFSNTFSAFSSQKWSDDIVHVFVCICFSVCVCVCSCACLCVGVCLARTWVWLSCIFVHMSVLHDVLVQGGNCIPHFLKQSGTKSCTCTDMK